MDLSTRCPQCGTTFLASLQQLQLRKGYIRCVNCAHIFDGYEAVVSPSSTPQEPSGGLAPPSVLRQRPASGAESLRAESPQAASHTVPVNVEIPRSQTHDPFTISTGSQAGSRPGADPVFRVGEPLSPPQSKSEPVIGQASTGPGQEPAIGLPQIRRRDEGYTSQIYVEPRHPALGSDETATTVFLDDGMPPGRGPLRFFWAALVVIGLFFLLAQLAYVYRAQIANQVTFLRPVLERACQPLHCKVPYARKIDAISIMSSSLRAGPDAAANGASGKAAAAGSDSMVLQLTLRNTYDKPQEWPTLVLDLKDFSGTLMVRKNLPPQSYLEPDVLAQAFPADSEVSISVPIALKGLKINGYQLEKFFQ